MVVEELQILVEAKVNAAVRDLKKLETQTNTNTATAGKLASSFLKGAAAFGGAALSIGALAATMKESVSLYAKQIEAEQTLAAAIRATGDDVDSLLPRYKEFASDLQGITVVGDEVTLGLLQQAKSLGINSDRIEEATKGAIGLSDSLGIGLQQALRGVANAMNGEFTTLQRYIPALRTANTEAEKQEILQRAMADGFEVSKAKAETATGDIAQLSNAIGDYKEGLGQAIAEGINPFVRGLTDIITKLNETREAKINLDKVLEGELTDQDSLTKAIEQQEKVVARLVEENELNGYMTYQLLEAEQDVLRSLERQLALRVESDEYAAVSASRQKEAAEQEAKREEDIRKSAEQRAEDLKILKTAYDETEEGAIKALEAQIKFFEAYKDGPMAQAVLNDLNAELVAMKESLWEDSPTDWVAEAMDSITEAEKRAIEAWAKQEEALIRQDQLVKNLAASAENALANAWTNSISAMAEALVEGENAFGAFAKTVLLGFADMLQSLSAQLAAYAVVGLFTTGGTLSPAALAGSAAAAAAAGVTRAAANNFKAGGEFTVPEGYENDNYMIGVSSGERVRVDNEDKSNNSSGGGTYHIHVHLGEAEVGSQIFKMSRNGQLMIADRAVVRA